jgi:uncharacterized membrane protein
MGRTQRCMSAYEFSIFLHISAVVVGLGATFAEAIAFPVAMKMDASHLPYLHRLQRAINQRLATPALLIIILTGMYQVSEGNWSYSDFWISATFAIAIILGGLNGAYFVPADRKLEAMAKRDIAAAPGEGKITMSDEYLRGARIEGIVGAIAGLLVIAAVFLMVVKP